MTSESHNLCSSVKSVANSLLSVSSSSLKSGLSLVELLIAIGIMGVTMLLIGAAFPAGVAMSIAVSDETTSQAVFQKALAEIKDKVTRADITPLGGNPFIVLDDSILGTTEAEILASRELTDTSTFSWSALIRPVDPLSTGPMGKLCQVVVVVSRRPTGSPNFVDDSGGDSELPELRSVNCTGSIDTTRTLNITSTDFSKVPNGGYIIDETTGTAYIIVSRNNNDTVTVLSEPPSGLSGNFWVVPGPNDGPKSPSIRVFQAMLYLP